MKHRISTLTPVLLFCLFTFLSCVSHLKEAKVYYAQAQKFSRLYRTEEAVSSFKRALREAELEVERHPSAQGYMVKGMAEINLELWKEAEESFRRAFSFGFEKGEEWAAELSLFGLASSLERLGLANSALKIYADLIEKSKLKPVTVLASQRYTDMMLKRALRKEGEEKSRELASVLKALEKLAGKDMSCGFYHYLLSQVYSHLSDYRNSFEEAVMARELGLPTEEIFRDNDRQIVFCYRMFKERLSPAEWEDFRSRYMEWVKRWGWQDAETPGWKKEAEDASLD